LSTVQSAFITISCDGPGCDKSVTFPATEQGKAEAFQDYPWLNALREVATVDRRQLSYCSDLCEAAGVGTGIHNKPERKRIITPGSNPAEVNLAAQAAAHARQANEALHSGAPVTI